MKSSPILSRYSATDWDIFASLLLLARQAMPPRKALCLSPVSPDNQLGEAFTDLAGLSGGYVARSGEIAGLFRHPVAKSPVLADLLAYSLGVGGWWLNCYAVPSLEKAYERAGLVPVALLPWSDSQAPEGWEDIPALAVRPPVLFFVHSSLVTDQTDGFEVVAEYADAVRLLQRFNPNPTQGRAFLGGIGQTVAPSFASAL